MKKFYVRGFLIAVLLSTACGCGRKADMTVQAAQEEIRGTVESGQEKRKDLKETEIIINNDLSEFRLRFHLF